MPEISWYNPLGYVHYTPDFDVSTNPCKDLNHFLSWVFWRSGVVHDRNAAPEDVTAVRQLMLNALRQKEMPSTQYKIPGADIYVMGMSDGGLFSLFLDVIDVQDETKDNHFCYCFDLKMWVEKYILEAIKLNQELNPNATPAPSPISHRRARPDWSPRIPSVGNIVVPAQSVESQGPTVAMHTRIIPEGSQAFRDCQGHILMAEASNDLKRLRALFNDGGAATYLDDEEFTRIFLLASHASSRIWSSKQ